MRLGIPQADTYTNILRMKDSLRAVVDTAKSIQESIAIAKGDKKHDRTLTINQLNINLKNLMDWGKKIYENIGKIEAENKNALLIQHI